MFPAAVRNLIVYIEEAGRHEHSVHAILLPLSRSARFSTTLAENATRVRKVTSGAQGRPPPSPSDSLNSESSSRTSSESSSEADDELCIFVLERSSDREKFSLGHSSHSDITLRHHPSDLEESSYINQKHVEIYPNPDTVSLVLHNASTATFAVRRDGAGADIGAEKIKHTVKAQLEESKRATTIKGGDKKTTEWFSIEPSCDFALNAGYWSVTLGKGLAFQIKVCSHPGDTYHALFPLPFQHSASPSKKGANSRDATSVKGIDPSSREKKPTPRCDSHAGSARPAAPKRSPTPPSQSIIAGKGLILGQNRHSTVYKMEYRAQTVAVKICRRPQVTVSASLWRNELDILHLLGESKITEQKHTRRIAELLVHDAKSLSMTFEYIGPDLARTADEHRFSQIPSDRHLRIWQDVAAGLQFIHSHRVVHRDIKPSNILLGDRRRGALICDFGLSTVVYQEAVRFVGGSPSYIPPEYLVDAPRGFEGDIWALGITMLFVFGLTALPQGDWNIAEVPRERAVRRKMISWIKEVGRLRSLVPDKLEPLSAMLEEDPSSRITANALLGRLSAEDRKLLT